MKVALCFFVLSAFVLVRCYGYARAESCAYIDGKKVCKQAETQGSSINAGSYTNGRTGRVWAEPGPGNMPIFGQGNFPMPGQGNFPIPGQGNFPINFPAGFPFNAYQR